MARIIFKRSAAMTVFRSMAQSKLEENADFDRIDGADACFRILEALDNAEAEGETTAQIEDRDAGMANDLIDACLENSGDDCDPEDRLNGDDAEVD